MIDIDIHGDLIKWHEIELDEVNGLGWLCSHVFYRLEFIKNSIDA